MSAAAALLPSDYDGRIRRIARTAGRSSRRRAAAIEAGHTRLVRLEHERTGSHMGLPRDGQEPAGDRPSQADPFALAAQLQAQAMQLQAQAMQLQRQLMQPGGQHQAAGGAAAAVGSMTWVRQVMALLAPPEPGYVKRCACAACGAPKKLPAVTAYVYCDYCASLADFDLRRACESDTAPGPGYAATVNAAHAAAQAAVAAGDRDAHRDLQRQLYQAYLANVPMAVSHRARNDPAYRSEYVEYMASAATARAFDPAARALDAELRQRVSAIRYGGNMMSPTVLPDSFWPVVDVVGRQIEVAGALYRSAGLAGIDPDHAGHLVGKLAWSSFCQGWLGMLPADAARQLLEHAGLVNEYVPVQAHDGQPRHCGGCGGEFSALPGARAVVCDGCGRTVDVGSAEIRCASCGATMTLPAGADRVACPFCQAQVARAGIR